MDPKEIDELVARVDRLKEKQAKIEAIERQMSEQASAVNKTVDAEAAMLRRIRLGPPPKEGADAGA
jgi:hypothetical protein